MFKLIRNFKLVFNNTNSLVKIERSICLTNANYLKKIEKISNDAKKTITIEGKFIDEDETNKSNLLHILKDVSLNEENSNENLKRLKAKYDSGDADQVKPCSFCLLEKQNIFVQYTDIPVLRQFLKEDGTVLQRKITGLCKKQQRKLLVLVKQARHAGLLLNLQPKLIDGSQPSENPANRKDHLKYNSYFDSYEIMKRTHKYL